MTTPEIVLEYLKVVLSGPIVASATLITFVIIFRKQIGEALEQRSLDVTLPGGTKISAQPTQDKSVSESKPKIEDPEVSEEEIPTGLTPEQQQAVVDLIKSYRANSYLWEYRYLNHFFVRSTQIVLDWLVTLDQATTYEQYDAVWLPAVREPEQRQAMIDALRYHHLIQLDAATGLITVTPKGREYHNWRGPLPDLGGS